MSLVQEIHDKNAVMAWSPMEHAPGYIALGTKVRGMLSDGRFFFRSFFPLSFALPPFIFARFWLFRTRVEPASTIMVRL